MNDFATKFRRLLNASGMSFRDIEKKTGISAATLCRYANGKFTPTVEKVKQIADALGVPPTSFVGVDYIVDDKYVIEQMRQLSDEGQLEVVKYISYLLATQKDGEKK